jgi:hypothetical protein
MDTDEHGFINAKTQGAKGEKFYENENEDDWVAARKPRWVHPRSSVVELRF